MKRHLHLNIWVLSLLLLCLGGCSEEENSIHEEESTYISAPTGLHAYASGSYITLDWNSVSNANQYHVYYSESYYGPWNFVSETTNTYTTLTASSTGTFYFVVTAVNNYAESSYSSPAYCTVQSSGGGNGGGSGGGNSGGGNGGGSTTTLPSAPTGLTGYRDGPAMYPFVYLSWNYTSGADSYIIYRSTSANGTYSQIGTRDSYSCAFIDENCKSGNNYYKVAAKNSAGIGPKSDYCLVSINNDSYKPDFSSIKGSASGYKLTFTWKAQSGTGYGKPEKVTISYYYNLTSSQRELNTKEFTGSQASSGSYTFSDCRYLMDSYNKVVVGFTISNSNGQNSYTIAYYNGSFIGTF